MVTLLIDEDSGYRRVTNDVTQYLLHKYQNRQSVVNAALERNIDSEIKSSHLRCACNEFKPTLYVRRLNISAHISNFPGHGALHAQDCQLLDKKTDGKALKVLQDKELAEGLVDELKLPVLFYRPGKGKPIYERWDETLNTLARKCHFLAGRLYAGRDEFNKAVATSMAKGVTIFLDISKYKDREAMLFYGSPKCSGPYFKITICRDGKTTSRYQIPVVSYSSTFMVHSDFERQLAKECAQLLKKGMRIESSYRPLKISSEEVHHAFRVKSIFSKTTLLTITGDPNTSKRVAKSYTDKYELITAIPCFYSDENPGRALPGEVSDYVTQHYT